MTRPLFITAFLLGAAAIVWMGAGFAGANTLAFAVTGIIGGVYLIGIIELLQFRRATTTLTTALAAIPDRTDDPGAWLARWLDQLDPSLQNAVRLRIEGERVGLPSPVFTPYLVGLLVMLGLLGTFVGMVDTLSGAVLALEGSTELAAVRAGLAAPIRGLGVAFGTSVAGVAASAMLGLISTLVRRDRMLGTRQLDHRIATVFRDFSLTHNRQQAYRAIQVQAQALPAVAERLQAMAQYLERMGDSIGEKLTANQALFHQSTEAVYTSLARSVDSSLKESLADSGRVAGESIRPVLADAVSSIGNSMAASAQEMSASAQANSTRMLAEIAALLQSSEQLVQTRITSEASWAASRQEHADRLTETLKTALAELREQEELRQESAVTRLAELESTVANHLTRLGQGLEEPMSRLIQTASETPRAAAEVIGQLRAEIAGTVERDNELLRERQRVMGELNTLSESLQHAAASQREAIENLVDSAATTLQEISSRFGDQIGAQALKIADATTDIAGGAVELSSMGEAFALAVELFSGSNQSMMEHLSRIEEAMERSSDRSDEQMAYYVAQAREIIDQSMLSQREIIEDLQRLGRVQQPVAAGAV